MPTDTRPVVRAPARPPVDASRRSPAALTPWLLGSLVLVALVTLTPAGRGWEWGDPATELRWYLSGLDSPSTVFQLLGNLLLLAPTAALAVLRWPALGHPGRLLAAALATATGIELLQRALEIGRVVSPLDAVLNAAGATAVGCLVAGAAALTRRASRA